MIGYLIFLAVLMIFASGFMFGFACGYKRATWQPPAPPKCPHGYDWDDCPVCCH